MILNEDRYQELKLYFAKFLAKDMLYNQDGISLKYVKMDGVAKYEDYNFHVWANVITGYLEKYQDHSSYKEFLLLVRAFSDNFVYAIDADYRNSRSFNSTLKIVSNKEILIQAILLWAEEIGKVFENPYLSKEAHDWFGNASMVKMYYFTF